MIPFICFVVGMVSGFVIGMLYLLPEMQELEQLRYDRDGR